MIVKKIFNMYKFLLPKCKQTAKSKQSKHNSSTYFANIRQVKKVRLGQNSKKGSNYYIIMKQTNPHYQETSFAYLSMSSVCLIDIYKST